MAKASKAKQSMNKGSLTNKELGEIDFQTPIQNKKQKLATTVKKAKKTKKVEKTGAKKVEKTGVKPTTSKRL
jgi:hypothetical protein